MPGEFDDSYTAYQTNRTVMRKLVRRAYLRSAASQLSGSTLDFGCGVGELLSRLPVGSKGVEYNRASVDHCRTKGLEVCWYDGTLDDWSLSTLPREWRFESMVISHVLEHLDAPIEILRRLLAAAAGRDVRRTLVILPGMAGFRIDDTHMTFVDWPMVRDAAGHFEGWKIIRKRYFPGNLRAIGDVFPHHELQVLLERC